MLQVLRLRQIVQTLPYLHWGQVVHGALRGLLVLVVPTLRVLQTDRVLRGFRIDPVVRLDLILQPALLGLSGHWAQLCRGVRLVPGDQGLHFLRLVPVVL